MNSRVSAYVFMLTMMVLVLIFLIVMKYTTGAGKNSTTYDYVFVLHDAGESYMVQPVINRMIIETNKSICILTIGEPSTSIYTNYSQQLLLSQLGIDIEIVDGYDRSQLLSTQDLQTLINAVQPIICISGMVYLMQSQIVFGFQSPYTVGLDDSFALWDKESLSAQAFVDLPQPRVDEVFCTAVSQAEGLAADSDKVIATVTGSPSLDSWWGVKSNTTACKQARQAIYGVEPFIIGVIFAGGYGNESYVASLRVYCESALTLTYADQNKKKESDTTHFRFVFTPHPGYPPEYEESLFEEWGCSNVVCEFSSICSLSYMYISLSCFCS